MPSYGDLNSVLDAQPALKNVLQIVYDGSYYKDPIEFNRSLCALRVSVKNIDSVKFGAGFELIITQMYEYVNFDFKTLKALSDFFGTDSIDVDNWNESGCETCDWGSRYQVTFQIYGATKNILEPCYSYE